MAKAKIDLIGRLVEELQTFSKLSEKAIMDVLIYNDLSGLGGDVVKIGDKTVRTLKETIKDNTLEINLNAEHILDIVQNGMGDITGFRSRYLDNSCGKFAHKINVCDKNISKTQYINGIRDILVNDGINGYSITKFDKHGLHGTRI